MFNKMVIKRLVCLLVALVAVCSSLSAQRLWKADEWSPFTGVFPSVGDYVAEFPDQSPYQVVAVEFYDDNRFLLVLTLASTRSFTVRSYTNDPFLVNQVWALPLAPQRFSLWLDSKSVRIMDKLTAGYRPSSVVGDSGERFSAGVDTFYWGVNYLGFSGEQVKAGEGFILCGFEGSGDWSTERNPVLYNPDGKTVFYTPYKGQ